MNSEPRKEDSISSVERTEAEHLEKQDVPAHRHGVTPVTDDQLPKGYYYSPLFLGSYMAQALGFMCAVGVYAMVAPNLAVINSDIGKPNSTIYWVAIVYTLMFGVGSALVGRISDMFGRRWFFTGGSLLAVIGNIVSSRAQNLPTLIGGMTLVGAAAASQVLFAVVIGELVPMKYRFLAGAGFYGLGAPFGMFATVVATKITLNLGWRWIFYIMAIVNSMSAACWYLFYHPPTFVMLHRGRETVKQVLKTFDYLGFVLFNGGFTLLLLGLSWGGQLYPWNGAHVLCALVIGAIAMIAFFGYEAFFSLKDPYIPLKLFRNRHYNAVTCTVTTASMVYYGFSIIYPTMIFTLYPSSRAAYGWKTCALTGTYSLGSFVGLAVASYVRRLKFFLVAGMILGTAFTGAVAAGTQHNEKLTASMMSLGSFFVGMVDSIALTLTSIVIDDQNEIGTAVGIAASIRSLGGAVANTVFSTILANRLKTTIAAKVPPALLEAGLPATSIAAFLQAIRGLIPFNQVPGLTPTTLAIGTDAYQTASSQAYRTCFLTNLAFCGLGVITSMLCPDANPETEHMVAKELHHKKEEKRLEKELVESDL